MRVWMRFSLLVLLFALLAGPWTSPANGQGLIDRLRDRLRTGLPAPGSPPALQPVPANGQFPPQQLPPQQAPPQQSQPPKPPSLGIEVLEQGSRAPFELVVQRVSPGSVAAAAGLTAGDVLLSLDDQPVGTIDQIANRVQAMQPGQTLRITLRRQGQPVNVVATFPNQDLGDLNPRNQDLPGINIFDRDAAGMNRFDQDPRSLDELPSGLLPLGQVERPVVERTGPGAGRFGVTVENVASTPPGAGVPVQRGAVIVKVQPASPANSLGLAVGDVIVAIDGVVMQDAAALIEYISTTKPGQQIEVSYYQGPALKRGTIRLGALDDGEVVASPAPAAEKPGMFGAFSGAIGGLFRGGGDPPASGSESGSVAKNDSAAQPAASQAASPVNPLENGQAEVQEELQRLRDQVRTMQDRINALEKQLGNSGN
ncbi:PDZ domain-containing protein [Planctomycetaceae bacterium SH139]